MKKQFLTIILILAISPLIGQNNANRHLFAFELDPAPFLLNGYSFSLKYGLGKIAKSSLMFSVFSANFPDKMMKKSNSIKGWQNMKIKTSYAVFSEFYLTDRREGFYYGPALFWYNKSVELAPVMRRMQFASVYPNFRIGYCWFPFEKLGLYLNPWLNVGSEIGLDDKNLIGDVSFELNRFNYIVAIHVGYRLGRR